MSILSPIGTSFVNLTVVYTPSRRPGTYGQRDEVGCRRGRVMRLLFLAECDLANASREYVLGCTAERTLHFQSHNNVDVRET